MTSWEASMGGCRTVSASEFKAKCLDILDRVGRRTGAGRDHQAGVAVAVLVPPAVEAVQVERLHGFLRGSVVIQPEIDLTAPVADEGFAADRGEIRR